MTEAEAQLAALQELVGQLAAKDAEQVVAEARAEARTRVRAALTDALTNSLREAVERRLASDSSSTAPPPKASPRTEPPPAAHEQPFNPDAAAPAPATPAGIGTYVYGVVWGSDAPFTEDLSGLDDDGPVTTVIEGRLAAVVSRVPLADFEEDELRSHLSDIDWVERVARAHEAVLDDLCARTVVVPMRMCTVYRSDENLRSMLQREEVNLRSALEFLDGKLEWGLKVVAQGDSDALAAPESGAAAPPPRRDEQAELEGLQADAAAEIHEALAELSHDGLLNPIQSSELPGRPGRLVMNGVYLVEREAVEEFHQTVEELEHRFTSLGLELQRTGPWPPYNFVPGDVGAAW